MSYTVSTDPSGNRLDLLNSIVYTNNNLKPIHNFTYQLRNNNGITVSDNFAPYSAPRIAKAKFFARELQKQVIYSRLCWLYLYVESFNKHFSFYSDSAKNIVDYTSIWYGI